MKDLSAGEIAVRMKEPYFRIIRRIKRNEFPNARKVGWGWVIPEQDLKDHDEKDWSRGISQLTKEKVSVQLISKQFEFVPSYQLRKTLNRK